jgi:hypothetical protein
MKEQHSEKQSLLKDFLADYPFTRRSFLKKATAATGTVAALGSLKPACLWRMTPSNGNP